MKLQIIIKQNKYKDKTILFTEYSLYYNAIKEGRYSYPIIWYDNLIIFTR